MKRYLILFLALVLCFGASVPAWAASTDKVLIVDGQHSIFSDNEYVIGYGRNIEGRIYVPLRVLFEATGAMVDYQKATRIITIRRADGAVLTMRPDDKQAKINHLGESKTLAMPGAPQLIDSTTYVPIRFAGENLLCSVEWDNDAKKVILQSYYVVGGDPAGNANTPTYTVDFAAEKVYEVAADGTVRLLGQIPGLKEQYDSMDGWLFNWSLSVKDKSEGGSYLFNLMGSPIDPPVFRYMTLLVTGHGQANRSICFNNAAVFAEDSIWWTENGRLQQINEVSGKVLAEYAFDDYLPALPTANSASFVFCDGKYLLLEYGTDKTRYPVFPALVNLQTGEVTDLFPLLIREEERKPFYYEDGSRLWFVKAEDGVLYFDHFKDGDFKREHGVRLSYKYR